MKLSTLSFVIGAAITSPWVTAQNIDIEVQNLSQGLYFTPIIIAAHNNSGYLFELGQSASSELQAMAEGGDISGLVTIANSIGANVLENPAAGLLAPAAKIQANLMATEGNMYLSLSAMILPSNDGFVGLDRWPIPTTAGTYHVYLNAYDAGTEANNELVVDGSGGAGVTSTEQNTMVHIHRGNLGDDDLNAGDSDLDNTVHRWLNPVAKLTVTVK